MIYKSGSIKETDTNKGNQEIDCPYFINCCGYIKLKNMKKVSILRTRVDYYLIYLVSGAGYYKINGKLIKAESGNIIIYQPHEEQDYYYFGEDNTELYWIHFTGNSVMQLLENLELTGRNIFQVGIKTELIQLFEKIIDEIMAQNHRYHSLCISYLINLLSMFSRESYAREKGVFIKNSGIEQSVIKMQREYQFDHSISYYAKSSNLSVYQFIRKFRNTMQYSPSKYVEKIRMDKSKELLLSTDLTINEISEVVGYNDPFYFSKVFKKNTGQSPSAFRKLQHIIDCEKECKPCELEDELFGKHGSGKSDLSKSYKKKVKEKINDKMSH